MTTRERCPVCGRPCWISPPAYKGGPRGISRHCRKHTPRKKYVIYFDPNHDHDYSRAWCVVDRSVPRWLNGVVEAGYTKAAALRAAAFHNFTALGPGPWRP